MLKKMEIKNIKIENPTHGIQIYKNAKQLRHLFYEKPGKFLN